MEKIGINKQFFLEMGDVLLKHQLVDEPMMNLIFNKPDLASVILEQRENRHLTTNSSKKYKYHEFVLLRGKGIGETEIDRRYTRELDGNGYSKPIILSQHLTVRVRCRQVADGKYLIYYLEKVEVAR